MTFEWGYVVEQWPMLMEGLLMTIQVTVLSIALSLLIGLLGAAARQFRLPVLSQLVVAYVELIRNTPILVQLFFIFYGLPSVGLGLSLYWSGVLCLSLWAGAYQIENIRGGLAVIDKGMREASLALGMKDYWYFRKVAVPIAFRTSLPAMLNTSISLLKNSSYLQAIGLAELTFVAVDRIATDFRAVEMFAAIGAIYLFLVVVLSAAAHVLETRLQRPFQG